MIVVPPCPELRIFRSRWLDASLERLQSDARVAGIALVGSLGRGMEDDWSDVDLLVVVENQALAECAEPGFNAVWSGATLVIDAHRNAPAWARSVSTSYVDSGLPLAVDWYIYPKSMARWPADCRVVQDSPDVLPSRDSFADINSRGPRGESAAPTAEVLRGARSAMVPIVGKYMAPR